MANLDVQPKKRNSILPWILLIFGLLALALLFYRGCGKDAADDPDTIVTPTDTTATVVDTTVMVDTAAWTNVDFNAPELQYEELTSRELQVRGAGNYAIYGLGEDILFDKGKATLRTDATDNLRQIAASIKQRFNQGEIRVYGHSDARGSSDANAELSRQRAITVRSWLAENGIDANRLSLHPEGESRPKASNATEAGRQENRRVEIVARNIQ